MESAPARMFEVLDACGALAHALPGLSYNDRLVRAMRCAAQSELTLPARYALMIVTGVSQGGDPLAEHLRVPGECRDLARMLLAEQGELARAQDLDARERLALLERLDAIRRPRRLPELLAASACLRQADGGDVQACQATDACLMRSLRAAREVDAGAIARQVAAQGPQAIRDALSDARTRAIEARAKGR